MNAREFLESDNYIALKQRIDRQYSEGRFVAIERGQVVADAPSHADLVEALQTSGKTPQGLVIVQAGVQYPDSAVIFLAPCGCVYRFPNRTSIVTC